MVHSHSKTWVRLLGLGLALGLMCTLLPAYAFAEEPSAEGSAAAQSAEAEQAAPEPAQAQPEAETAQAAPETAQPQPAAEMPTDETAIEPVAGSINAAIYYLADPAGDPLTNNTGAWAPSQDSSTLIAQINTTGASWDHNDGKNITKNVASYITTWPDGSTGSAPGDKTAFPHTPTDAQLTDGVVNYYAHYVPVMTSVTVTKQVPGPMGDRNKQFSFQWSCGEQNGSFTLSDGQSFTIENVGVGETLTLTESDNSGYAVSVSYGGQNYNVTTAADAQSSSVQLAVAQDGGAITVTNHKDVNPDTGITLDSAPYAVALGLAAVTAAVLLYRRSRRRG